MAGAGAVGGVAVDGTILTTMITIITIIITMAATVVATVVVTAGEVRVVVQVRQVEAVEDPVVGVPLVGPLLVVADVVGVVLVGAAAAIPMV